MAARGLSLRAHPEGEERGRWWAVLERKEDSRKERVAVKCVCEKEVCGGGGGYIMRTDGRGGECK